MLIFLSTASCDDCESRDESSIVLDGGRRSASKKEWPPRRDVDDP